MIYRSIAIRTRGYSHQLKNKVNQDHWKIEELDDITIIAVADGHGNEKHARSDSGSLFAVNAFCSLIVELRSQSSDLNDFSLRLNNHNLSSIPEQIVCNWRRLVEKDFYKKRTSNNKQLMKIIDKMQLFSLYGSTLLGLVVTDRYYWAFQLGDGDIVSVDYTGESQRVIKKKPIIGVETDSLCSREAWKDVQVKFIEPAHLYDMPVLFMLSTDGFTNSYATDRGFLQAGQDICDWMKEEDLFCSIGREKLRKILAETSRQGSGDDITLALVANTERIQGKGEWAIEQLN